MKDVFQSESLFFTGLIVISLIFAGCSSPSESDSNGDNSEDENSDEQTEETFAGGDGSEESPYEIETFAQLDAVRKHLTSNFILVSDIDASESDGFNPIGNFLTDSEELANFEGTLDGDEHTISNLTINFTYEEGKEFGVGVFNELNGASVKNITFENLSVQVDVASSAIPDKFFAGGLVGRVLDDTRIENVTITGSIEAPEVSQIGGLAGFNMGTIIDSNVEMNVTSNSDSTGGVVGFNRSAMEGAEASGKIENVEASGTIKGEHTVGGAVGFNKRNTTIQNVSFSGEVQGNDNVGGLVGVNRGSISDSNADSRVKGNNENIGGLVGYNVEKISASSASGKVTGTHRVGGFVGWLNDGEVTNAEATGNVEGKELVGGLAGFNSTADINDSNAKGDVSGTEDVGGLVGNTQSETVVKNSKATGDVNGEILVGGLIGFSLSPNVENTSAEGDVNGQEHAVGGLIGFLDEGGSVVNSSAIGSVSGGRNVGGLVGNVKSASIKRSYASGNVDGDNRVGGLVGVSRVDAQILESYATGSASGNRRVGGLVGYQHSESIIEKSYVRGDVSGSFSSGGIVGDVAENTEIRNSYSVGEIAASSGESQSGGLVGELDRGEVYESYWDTNTTQQDSGIGNIIISGTVVDIAGLTTSEMSGSSAENNMSHFDFENTWTTTADSYPELQWQED